MAQCEPVFFVLLIASQKVSIATTLILKMVREREKKKKKDYSDTHSTEENVEKTTIISPHQSLVLPP